MLGELLAEDSELQAASHELMELVASARTLFGQIESGRGLVGRLVLDDEYGRTTTERVDAILADLSEILRKIEEGEGTLGKLLNEPELYDEATNVVGGLSDSRFLRWVARRVRNKEIKRKIGAYAEELEAAERAGGKPAAGASKP